MRLLLDEMLSPSIAEGCDRRGCDVEAVQGTAGFEGLKDEELLRAALGAGRAVVTDNVADFSRLHLDFLRRGEGLAGIVLARLPRSKDTIGLWIRTIELFVQREGAASLVNRLTWLS